MGEGMKFNFIELILTKLLMNSGLYYGPGEETFKTKEEIIKSKIQTMGETKIEFNGPKGKDSQSWFEEATRRQETRSEVEDNYQYAKIEMTSDRPVVIGLTSDWHLGADVDYDMLKRDVGVMAQYPLVRGVFFLGDLTDSANFNPAQDEDMLSYEEQRQFMMSALEFIGKDRILAMWKGNHDHKWESKGGVSKYAGLSQKYQCPVFYGPAFIELVINGVTYKVMGSHQLKGNSMYNNAHGAIRGHRETQGVDIVVSGHTHRRGTITQPVREFNDARTVYGATVGTYQKGSGYAKDSGYGPQNPQELGMYWLILGHDRKLVTIESTEGMLNLTSRFL